MILRAAGLEPVRLAKQRHRFRLTKQTATLPSRDDSAALLSNDPAAARKKHKAEGDVAEP
jgi:hypothetical protein